jgi:hypothetical protein
VTVLMILGTGLVLPLAQSLWDLLDIVYFLNRFLMCQHI